MNDEGERIVVYHPGESEAGLAVNYDPNPGPHRTKFTVEQLWAPATPGEPGEADPVFVGDEERAVGLIVALAEALEIDMELRHA